MDEFKVLIAGSCKYLEELNVLISEIGAKVTKCQARALEIQRIFLTEKPHIIFIENLFDCSELIDNIICTDNAPDIYIYCRTDDSFSGHFSEKKRSGVFFINGRTNQTDLMKKVRLGMAKMFQESCESGAHLHNRVSVAVYNALSELGFTANYTGTLYLKKSLVAMCLGIIKPSDSMTKTIYPYLSREFGVTETSVERCIRTAVGKCWGNADDEIRIHYFGYSYSRQTGIPTNREFMMILADSIMHNINSQLNIADENMIYV